jgi:Tc toxin complex TcA C-terminal TcB-binding domain
MPTLTQRLSTYSYIDRPAMAVGAAAGTDVALLAQIDAILAEAADYFNAREYDKALSAYFDCESLIYTHLDPQWDPAIGGKVRPRLPRDPALFDPLLSATSQWLNILSVPAPASPVRPPTAPAPALLAGIAGLHGAGLVPVSANPAATAAALSDMQLAAIFTEQGNSAASSATVARARTLDATVAGTLAPAAAAVAPTVAAAAPAAATVAPAVAPALLERSVEIPLAATIVQRPIVTLPIALLAQREAGLLSGSGPAVVVKPIQWAASGNPDISAIKSIIYTPHITALLPDVLLNGSSLVEKALYLPHYYFYTIPLAIAQCQQALGDYANAETYYLQAAGYAYINTATEGPYVWLALAGLYSQWGDDIYKQGDLQTAATIYAKVITPSSTAAPATPLYQLAGLATAAQIATGLLPQLATLVTTGIAGVSADNVAIASALLKIYGKLTQIGAGLDFWGNYAAAVPIWTFRYLQEVAINFAQLAQQAENQVINYWSQADQATLTKTELTNQVAQANGQVNAAQQQLAATQAQVNVYQAGLTVAQTRATDSALNASEYQSTNSQVIIVQATGQQVSGGDDGDYNGVSAMASQYLSGQTISGDSATVAAATDLAANRLSQQYQVDSMNRTTTEMQQAATEAQAQLTAAKAQVTAAGANLAVAQLGAQTSAQTLSVFDSDTFTPQVWTAMGDFIEGIYDRYMDMALRAARLMQQAYNFENDVSLAYIQSSYSGVVQGLLGADALMADIQAFTDDLVNSSRGKKQYVKQSISLASRYGYLFETQLRKTGTMTFETTLDDFESAYPGTYQGRIQKVTVSVQGIVPPAGVSGTLGNNGISFYRVPSDIATPAAPSKIRVQSAETLVISDYNPALDGVIDSSSGDQTGIFEGAGIASSWTLSLPPAVNDINYGTLTDVVLTVLYEARFDPQLVQPVLAQLASRPGFNSREMSVPLAWMYPDLFYGFVATGALTLTLAAADFPANQTAPVVGAVSLLVAMAPGTPASGITISLTAPGKAALSGTTDATGMISSQTAGSAWAGGIGGSALGGWTITLTAAANPALAPGGKLNLAGLINLVLLVDYTFKPR